MEFKSSLTTIFFLFLFVAPYLSRGESSSSDHDHHVMVDSEVYEIDYRGPETHSSIPPPDHTHAKPLVQKETSSNYPKSKARDFGRKVKKIHG